MKQQPCYLIIGNGRMASHTVAYFQLLGLAFNQWHRKQAVEQLNQFIDQSTHILLLISDGAIEPFIKQHQLHQHNKWIVHFSGALSSDNAYSAHPLMTFNQQTYDYQTYKRILFVAEKDGPDLSQLLPGIPNKAAYIAKTMKPYYHCLGSLANNFTTMLWQTYFDELKEQFNIEPEDVFPILEQTLTNIKNDYKTALTGPLARGDQNTIDKHLKVLNGSPLQDIYQGFIKLHQQQDR